MTASKIARAVVVASVLISSEAFAGGPFGTIHVGLWKGGAYTSDQGAFTHCAAGSDYLNGVGLIIAQMADRSWTIGFTNPTWDLTIGSSFPIDVIFDGQSQFRIFGNAAQPKLIAAPLPDVALARLRKSHLMVATGNTQTFQFNVSTVSKLLPVIANCVDKIKSEGVANAGDFSLLPPRPAVASPVRSTAVESEKCPKQSQN